MILKSFLVVPQVYDTGTVLGMLVVAGAPTVQYPRTHRGVAGASTNQWLILWDLKYWDRVGPEFNSESDVR